MLPQAKGLDGGEEDDSDDEYDSEGGGQVRVAGRKSHKRRKTGSGKEVRAQRWLQGAAGEGCTCDWVHALAQVACCL